MTNHRKARCSEDGFMQTNKNLLLSDEANQYQTELKIFANDVKCKHGATIGQLNADAFSICVLGFRFGRGRRLLSTLLPAR